MTGTAKSAHPIQAQTFVLGAAGFAVLLLVLGAASVWLAGQGYPLAAIGGIVFLLLSGWLGHLAVKGGVSIGTDGIRIVGPSSIRRVPRAEVRAVLVRHDRRSQPTGRLQLESGRQVRLAGATCRHRHDIRRPDQPCSVCASDEANLHRIAATLGVPVEAAK